MPIEESNDKFSNEYIIGLEAKLRNGTLAKLESNGRIVDLGLCQCWSYTGQTSNKENLDEEVRLHVRDLFDIFNNLSVDHQLFPIVELPLTERVLHASGKELALLIRRVRLKHSEDLINYIVESEDIHRLVYCRSNSRHNNKVLEFMNAGRLSYWFNDTNQPRHKEAIKKIKLQELYDMMS